MQSYFTMLDLRRLRLLRELAHRGTIGAVASALDYSPSAVSQQLALLEKEAGVPLLERAGRNVRLTAAAQTLVGHTDALLARVEEAEADLQATAEQITGTVRVATFQSAGLFLLAPALRRLADAASGAARGGDGRRAGADDADARARRAGPRARRRVPVPSAPARRAPAPGAAAGGAVPAPAARRSPRGARTAAPVPLRALAGDAVGGGQGRHPLRRADDPRVPGARRLRAGHPAPLQRPADAARARRERAGA